MDIVNIRHSDPHSIPVGGGNAPIHSIANKPQRRRTRGGRGCEEDSRYSVVSIVMMAKLTLLLSFITELMRIEAHSAN